MARFDRGGEGRFLSEKELRAGVESCMPPLADCEHVRQECESLTYLDRKVHCHHSSMSGLSDKIFVIAFEDLTLAVKDRRLEEEQIESFHFWSVQFHGLVNFETVNY